MDRGVQLATIRRGIVELRTRFSGFIARVMAYGTVYCLTFPREVGGGRARAGARWRGLCNRRSKFLFLIKVSQVRPRGYLRRGSWWARLIRIAPPVTNFVLCVLAPWASRRSVKPRPSYFIHVRTRGLGHGGFATPTLSVNVLEQLYLISLSVSMDKFRPRF